MILVLDNYDSFTYNLVHYIGECGEEVFVTRNDEISVDEINDLNPKKIVVSPGPCTPAEAGISVELIKSSSVPVLGVCLGHQAIGAAFGGKIIKAPEIFHGKLSEVKHSQEALFQNIESPYSVVRYHSLVIEKDSLPGFGVDAKFEVPQGDIGIELDCEEYQRTNQGIDINDPDEFNEEEEEEEEDDWG